MSGWEFEVVNLTLTSCLAFFFFPSAFSESTSSWPVSCSLTMIAIVTVYLWPVAKNIMTEGCAHTHTCTTKGKPLVNTSRRRFHNTTSTTTTACTNTRATPLRCCRVKNNSTHNFPNERYINTWNWIQDNAQARESRSNRGFNRMRILFYFVFRLQYLLFTWEI